ncbi:hypothetical protein EAF04_010291 [Stromatinia cepivora]|nr:hypothetical protein EAF04_010291 [Stromatinia cepivora]
MSNDILQSPTSDNIQYILEDQASDNMVNVNEVQQGQIEYLREKVDDLQETRFRDAIQNSNNLRQELEAQRQELEAQHQKLKAQHQKLKAQHQKLKAQHQKLKAQHQKLKAQRQRFRAQLEQINN